MVSTADSKACNRSVGEGVSGVLIPSEVNFAFYYAAISGEDGSAAGGG